tara:strand:+ start:8961 stop:11162 length:2202 start_codon:yes stop_codon:yes gene_type:complete
MKFPIEISLFPTGVLSVTPVFRKINTESQLRQLFETPHTKPVEFPKKQLACWSPAVYKAENRRANGNVTEVTILVYEFDHTSISPHAMIQRLRDLNVSFVVHTTWSHRPSEPRYRTLLFLGRPLQPTEYDEAWRNGLKIVGYDSGVDHQSRNISRHYILPFRKEGAPYISEIFIEGKLLDADKISQKKQDESDSGDQFIPKSMKIKLDNGRVVPILELREKGEGKHKCYCPFQPDASAGSAFVRIMKDGRAFIRCTSDRHTHAGGMWWLQKGTTSKKSPARSVDGRRQRISEVPDHLLQYAEENIAYNTLQGVFYRHINGGWKIDQPMKKDMLVDHFIGLLSQGSDKRHADAMVDHILSRQVYGFGCEATKDRIIYQNNVPLLNLYSWPDLFPQQGDYQRIRSILEIICDNDASAIDWLMNWSAALIQNPERRSMVAVLVLSPQQGIGKSLYGRLLAEMIGKRNVAVVSNRALRDSFNAHYVTKLLVLADEVGIDRGSKDVVAELKAHITDDNVHCAAPYAARTQIVNRMSWWMTSNKRRPFLVESDDRRYTILSPAKASKKYRLMLRDCFDPQTSKFMPDFYQEIQGFAEHLVNLQVDYHLISRPHTTIMKQELQEASLGSAESFVEILTDIGPAATMGSYPAHSNYLRVADSVLSKAVPCETLYGTYREWCIREGRTDIKTERMFRLIVKDLPGVKIQKARISGRNLDVYMGLKIPEKSTKPKGQVTQLYK